MATVPGGKILLLQRARRLCQSQKPRNEYNHDHKANKVNNTSHVGSSSLSVYTFDSTWILRAPRVARCAVSDSRRQKTLGGLPSSEGKRWGHFDCTPTYDPIAPEMGNKIFKSEGATHLRFSTSRSSRDREQHSHITHRHIPPLRNTDLAAGSRPSSTETTFCAV